jgi:6-phosphogluconolactonase
VSDVELVVVDDAEAAARAVAERLAQAARHGGHIVLTGGSTPGRAYELAAELEPDWSRTEVYFTDERCVPSEDENSNYRLVKTALLDRLREPPAVVHRMPGELPRDQGAIEYEREELGNEAFDLVLLGLGPDGHVASLFPNAPTLQEERRRVIPAEAALEPFVDRVTLSIPALCSARAIVFALAGAEKAAAARRAFAEEPSPATPASLVRSRHGSTTAILDRAAAAELPA